MPPAPSRSVNLISNALAILETFPGWETDFTEVLHCHPKTPALIFRAHSTDIVLMLCPACLRVYLQVGAGLVCTSVDVVEDRICQRCSKVAPNEDFVGRQGFPTRFCSACRVEWGLQKRKAEADELLVAEAAEEADVKRSLAAMRVDLRRIAVELGELE